MNITSPVIIWNLLFLGVIASFLCYFLWNITIKAIGPAKAANFIYFNPLVAIIASSIILHEPLSAATLVGAAAIIAGVYLSTR
ncbi:MAG: DMT family transporter [Muribaculaceae bacterium]|nr:DMT family transporter [Muribaculaceae bacterium]